MKKDQSEVRGRDFSERKHFCFHQGLKTVSLARADPPETSPQPRARLGKQRGGVWSRQTEQRKESRVVYPERGLPASCTSGHPHPMVFSPQGIFTSVLFHSLAASYWSWFLAMLYTNELYVLTNVSFFTTPQARDSFAVEIASTTISWCDYGCLLLGIV